MHGGGQRGIAQTCRSRFSPASRASRSHTSVKNVVRPVRPEARPDRPSARAPRWRGQRDARAGPAAPRAAARPRGARSPSDRGQPAGRRTAAGQTGQAPLLPKAVEERFVRQAVGRDLLGRTPQHVSRRSTARTRPGPSLARRPSRRGRGCRRWGCTRFAHPSQGSRTRCRRRGPAG